MRVHLLLPATGLLLYAVDMRDVHIGTPNYYRHQSAVTSLPIARHTNGPGATNHPPRQHGAQKVYRGKFTGLINWPPLQDGILVNYCKRTFTAKSLQD